MVKIYIVLKLEMKFLNFYMLGKETELFYNFDISVFL